MQVELYGSADENATIEICFENGQSISASKADMLKLAQDLADFARSGQAFKSIRLKADSEDPPQFPTVSTTVAELQSKGIKQLLDRWEHTYTSETNLEVRILGE